MEQLLAYTCYELDCYLDEIKGSRRGKTSAKRRVAMLVLLLAGASFKEIGIILHKNESSLREAEKRASNIERTLAENIFLGFSGWKSGRFDA